MHVHPGSRLQLQVGRGVVCSFKDLLGGIPRQLDVHQYYVLSLESVRSCCCARTGARRLMSHVRIRQPSSPQAGQVLSMK
jgi:hypothetical protein